MVHTRDQHYDCRACGQNVSEVDLNRHHYKHHSDIPLDENIFELLEIDDVLDDAIDDVTESEEFGNESKLAWSKGKHYICIPCSKRITPDKIKYHHAKCRTAVLVVEVENGEYDTPVADKPPKRHYSDDSAESPHSDGGEQYMCRACNRYVSDRDLSSHHFKRHADIPLEVDIYELL